MNHFTAKPIAGSLYKDEKHKARNKAVCHESGRHWPIIKKMTSPVT